MCSLVGYVGTILSKDFLCEGLARLEYRGYDSAGLAFVGPEDNHLIYARSTGSLSDLEKRIAQEPINGFVGLGHTRWATHGVSSSKNAHPHFDCEKSIAVVHNGIIENHYALRQQLQESGHTFHSQTDTEVIAHLFNVVLLSHKSLRGSLVDLVSRLRGAYAFAAIMHDVPDTMIVVKKRSPLYIGIGDDEMFVASDVRAFIDKTKKVLFLPDESFAVIKKDMVELYDFKGSALPILIQDIECDWDRVQKESHDHYMLKEIYEQKNAIQSTVAVLDSIRARVWDHVSVCQDDIRGLKHIVLVGSGTSWHAALIAQFFFEEICHIPARVYLASEFRYKRFFFEEGGLYIVLSQSGETADSLAALRLINDMGLPTVAVTNNASSQMVREAGGFLLTQAGHEVAVASTKAFSTQLTTLYWFAHRIGLERGLIDNDGMNQARQDLLVAAELLENSIENYKIQIVADIAKKYAVIKKAIFIGRHVSYPFALEAALKLKSVSYIFSQCYPAGELRHGPLALVDDETPVFIFSHQDALLYQKIVSNAQEVKARNGHIVAFVFEGQHELSVLADTVFVVPRVTPLLGPLSMTGLMQFFVYQLAVQRGCSIDTPRNLVKSVTVE